MAWNPEHKYQSRGRILDSAARLFTTCGFDAVSIDRVMQDAGMTRGAFYSHFKSKSELYSDAMGHAAKAAIAGVKASCDSRDPYQLLQRYLSQQHRNGEQFRCPLAFLVTDVAQQDSQVRETYTRLFSGFIDNLSQQRDDSQREQLLQQAVMLVGGMAIARALSDDQLADELLQACQKAISGNG